MSVNQNSELDIHNNSSSSSSNGDKDIGILTTDTSNVAVSSEGTDYDLMDIDVPAPFLGASSSSSSLAVPSPSPSPVDTITGTAASSPSSPQEPHIHTTTSSSLLIDPPITTSLSAPSSPRQEAPLHRSTSSKLIETLLCDETPPTIHPPTSSKDHPTTATADNNTPYKEGSGHIGSAPYNEMTIQQRQRLRIGIQTIILLLIHKSTQGYQDLHRILSFIHFCTDVIVIDEMLYILLALVVDGGERMLIALTEACGGPDEVAAFILHTITTNDHEEIRCNGIRLLTYYYLKIETLPTSVINLTLRTLRSGNSKYSNNLITRTVANFTSNITSNMQMSTASISTTSNTNTTYNTDQNIHQRLANNGGLTLLREYLYKHYNNKYSDATTTNNSNSNSNNNSAGIQTYSTLLEMLLMKPALPSSIKLQTLYNTADQILIQSNGDNTSNNNINDNYNNNNSPRTPHTPGRRFAFSLPGTPTLLTPIGGTDNTICGPSIMTKFGQKRLTFAHHYISYYDQVDRNDANMINPLILPLFCSLISKYLPLVQHQVIGDLFSLVVCSSGNCDNMNTPPLWNALLLLLQCVVVPDSTRGDLGKVRTEDLATILNTHALTSTTTVPSSFAAATGVAQYQSSTSASSSSMYLGSRSTRRRQRLIESWTSLFADTYATDAKYETEFSPKNTDGDASFALPGPSLRAKNSSVICNDTCYAMLVRSFSLLLLNHLKYESGWNLVSQLIAYATHSCEYSDDLPGSSKEVTQACIPYSILSHLLCDMSSLMRTLYGELKLLVKTNNTQGKRDATIKITNIVSIITYCSLYTLGNARVMTDPIADYKIGVLRYHDSYADEGAEGVRDDPAQVEERESNLMKRLQPFSVDSTLETSTNSAGVFSPRPTIDFVQNNTQSIKVDSGQLIHVCLLIYTMYMLYTCYVHNILCLHCIHITENLLYYTVYVYASLYVCVYRR